MILIVYNIIVFDQIFFLTFLVFGLIILEERGWLVYFCCFRSLVWVGFHVHFTERRHSLRDNIIECEPRRAAWDFWESQAFLDDVFQILERRPRPVSFGWYIKHELCYGIKAVFVNYDWLRVKILPKA